MGLKIVWPVVRMLFPILFRSWSFPWNGHFNFLASWNKILKQEMKAKVMGIGLEYGEITTSFIWITRIWGMKSIPAVGQAGPSSMAAVGMSIEVQYGAWEIRVKVLGFTFLSAEFSPLLSQAVSSQWKNRGRVCYSSCWGSAVSGLRKVVPWGRQVFRSSILHVGPGSRPWWKVQEKWAGHVGILREIW